MLPLNDPRWTTLRSIYGSGSNVAEQLRQLEAGTLPEKGKDHLWQELCHQHTSSEAGNAAVPHLVRLAEQREPEEAFHLLHWAGWILTCGLTPGTGSHALPADVAPFLAPAAQRGLHRMSQLLPALPRTSAEEPYLLATLAAFMGRYDLATLLDYVDGTYCCPHCEGEIELLDSRALF